MKKTKKCKCKKDSDNCKCEKQPCIYLCNNVCCNEREAERYNETVQKKKPKKERTSKYGKTNKLGKRQRIATEGKVFITDTNKIPKVHLEETSAYKNQNALLKSLSSIPLLTNILPRTNNNQQGLYTGSYGNIPDMQIKIEPKEDGNEQYELFLKELKKRGVNTDEEQSEQVDNILKHAEDIFTPKKLKFTPVSPKYKRIAKKVFGNEKKQSVEIVREYYKNRFEGKTEDELREMADNEGVLHGNVKTKEGIIGAIIKKDFDRVNTGRGGGGGAVSPLFTEPEEVPSLTEQEDTEVPDAMDRLMGIDY